MLAAAAAVAVAVPSFLVSACSGQGGSDTAVLANPTSAEASQTREPARRQQASASASASTSARTDSSSRQRTSSLRAVQLLAQAAQAAIVTSYQGDEVATRWINGTESVLVSDIWHISGGQTVTQTLDAGTTITSRPYLSADNDGQAPEGALGVTLPLVQLLESHYVVAYAGSGSADDRTAQVIEAWRPDGSLAARFWLDERHQAAPGTRDLRHLQARHQP